MREQWNAADTTNTTTKGHSKPGKPEPWKIARIQGKPAFTVFPHYSHNHYMAVYEKCMHSNPK
jgi:hypothetical protein